MKRHTLNDEYLYSMFLTADECQKCGRELTIEVDDSVIYPLKRFEIYTFCPHCREKKPRSLFSKLKKWITQ